MLWLICMTSKLKEVTAAKQVEIVRVLHDDPLRQVLCPQCECANLKYFDIFHKSNEYPIARHIYCDNCGFRLETIQGPPDSGSG
jgi:hypothetical protein